MSDIMGHYTWSAMKNCFIIDVDVIVVWDLYPECS